MLNRRDFNLFLMTIPILGIASSIKISKLPSVIDGYCISRFKTHSRHYLYSRITKKSTPIPNYFTSDPEKELIRFVKGDLDWPHLSSFDDVKPEDTTVALIDYKDGTISLVAFNRKEYILTNIKKWSPYI